MRQKDFIILIEDDPDDQEVLQEVFNDLEPNYELRIFDDCDRAYEYLFSLQEKPFLILCDINLPKMDGIQLKRKIDDTDHLRRRAIPFIFLTTSNSQQTIDAAYRITNLQGYFQKSHTLADIQKKIRIIMNYWREALHPDGG